MPDFKGFVSVCLVLGLWMAERMSGKRESDLRLLYVLLINDFPLIYRVVFPNWDADGNIFANHFLIGLPFWKLLFFGLLMQI